MPDPTKYTPAYDFSNFQAVSPNAPLPGDRVDIELQNLDVVIEALVEAVKDVRRADGKLQNGCVTSDSLDPTVSAGLAADVLTALGPQAEASIQEALPQWRGAWATATVYDVNDLARENGSTYICLVAHTAGTFATDLSAGRWELFAQQGSAGAGTGDMLAANNLSDVADVAAARTNLAVATADATLLKAGNLSGLASPATALVNLGLTATAAQLNALGSVTASVAELNLLDGALVTTAELNHVDGVTGPIQTQLDGKQASLGFTPVQQGGGASQGANKIYLGWDSAGSRLRLQVDASDQGRLALQAEIPNAAAVMAFLATNMTANAIGAPCMMQSTRAAGTLTSYGTNSVINGAGLTFSNADGSYTFSGPGTSTWRTLGVFQDGTGTTGGQRTTLMVRVT